MIKPTEGKITSDFGFRIHPIRRDVDFHPGVDYSHITTSDRVYSVENGKVRYINNDIDGYGKYIVIEHDGYCSLYAHLNKIFVKVNQEVIMGQEIAIKGTTGSSTGIHLHFEIRKCPYSKFWERFYNGEWKHAVDPEKFYLERGFNMHKDIKDGWKTEIGTKAINDLFKKGKINSPDMHIENLKKGNIEPWLIWEMFNRLSE